MLGCFGVGMLGLLLYGSHVRLLVCLYVYSDIWLSLFSV